MNVAQADTCGLEEDQTFCAQESAPTEPAALGCDEALPFFCDAARGVSQFKCVQCTGKFADHAAMQRARCTDGAEAAFCSNATCYDSLDAQCGNEVSCSSCAECAMSAAVPPGQVCGADTRKRYCDPLPNTLLAIGGCDKAGDCPATAARMDVYGVLQQAWSNGTALEWPRAGAGAGPSSRFGPPGRNCSWGPRNKCSWKETNVLGAQKLGPHNR